MKTVLFAACLAAAANAALFEETFTAYDDGVPRGWTMWTPRPSMKLATAAAPGAFRMAGGGNPQAKGRITRTLTGFETGQWYRFEVRYTAAGVANPRNAALAIIEMAGNQNLRVLTPESDQGGRVRSAFLLQFPKLPSPELKLHLFAGYIPKGSIGWERVTVTHLPGYQAPKRPVRIAVVDSQPAVSGTAEANAAHYAAEIDKICAGAPKTDLVLLPENFNKSKVAPPAPVSFDSPYMTTLREAARRNRVYLAGSVYEERDGVPYNAGILLDRKGALAGYYRKTHLTIGEMAFSDIGRGDELPVFQTDFAKIGIAVCFDFHYPEAARILAVKGAEIVVVPMAADDRMRGADRVARSAEWSGKTFAMENRIPVVFAATLGKTNQPSLILDQHGEVLARTSDQCHAVAADLDLAVPALRWSGDEWRAKYTVGRRPEIYGELGTR